MHAFVLDEFVRDYALWRKSFKTHHLTQMFWDNISRIDPFMIKRIDSKMEYESLLRDGLIFFYCEPLIKKPPTLLLPHGSVLMI